MRLERNLFVFQSVIAAAPGLLFDPIAATRRPDASIGLAFFTVLEGELRLFPVFFFLNFRSFFPRGEGVESDFQADLIMVWPLNSFSLSWIRFEQLSCL